MKRLVAGLCGFVLVAAALCSARPLLADNPDFPGYLGVYVVESNGGMQIQRFIPDTPAEQLANMGEINRGDVIVRLAGRNTTTLQQLRQARNTIPIDKEAKMVLRNRRGQAYHVWISRNEPTAAVGSPADTFSRPAPGEGDEGDFRDRRSGSSSPRGSNPDIRDR